MSRWYILSHISNQIKFSTRLINLIPIIITHSLPNELSYMFINLIPNLITHRQPNELIYTFIFFIFSYLTASHYNPLSKIPFSHPWYFLCWLKSFPFMRFLSVLLKNWFFHHVSQPNFFVDFWVSITIDSNLTEHILVLVAAYYSHIYVENLVCAKLTNAGTNYSGLLLRLIKHKIFRQNVFLQTRVDYFETINNCSKYDRVQRGAGASPWQLGGCGRWCRSAPRWWWPGEISYWSYAVNYLKYYYLLYYY